MTLFPLLQCHNLVGSLEEESWDCIPGLGVQRLARGGVLATAKGLGAVAVFVFETGRSQSHYVTEDDLEFLTFLPPTSKCEVCITMTILYSTRDQTPL